VTDQVRIDKWLWAARFFKTRGKARDAINGGKVQLNGSRVKPGRALKTGDCLRIHREDGEFIITVLGTSSRRRPASQAQELYLEDEESRLQREELAEQKRLQRSSRMERDRRPDKRQRRRLIRFRQDSE
jgi:ribosome-associated heat shock protein Hsp15